MIKVVNTISQTALRYVEVPEKTLENCSIKVKFASELTLDDIRNLVFWCDCQNDILWDGMSLQEILNVYRVSAEWDTWECWSDADWEVACEAWNSAVIDPGNMLTPRV